MSNPFLSAIRLRNNLKNGSMPSPWPYGTPIGTCLETRMRIKACEFSGMTILGVGPFVRFGALFQETCPTNDWPKQRPVLFATFPFTHMPYVCHAPPCTPRPPVVRLRVDGTGARGAPVPVKFPAKHCVYMTETVTMTDTVTVTEWWLTIPPCF